MIACADSSVEVLQAERANPILGNEGTRRLTFQACVFGKVAPISGAPRGERRDASLLPRTDLGDTKGAALGPLRGKEKKLMTQGSCMEYDLA